MSKHVESEIRLGRMEMQIMNEVWGRGTATVRDVHEALSRGRSPAYSTVLTMMRKLEIKGYLSHQVQDRTYIYRATISRGEARRSIVGTLLDRLFEGSAVQLMTSLIEEKKVSRKELEQIHRLLQEDKRGPRHE